MTNARRQFDHDSCLAACLNMETTGGEFAACIAHAWFAADSENKARLETTFAGLFDSFGARQA